MKKNYIKNIGLFLIKGLPLIVVFIYCLNCIRFDVEPRTETTQEAVYVQEEESTYVSKSVREYVNGSYTGLINNTFYYELDGEIPNDLKFSPTESYFDIEFYDYGENESYGELYIAYSIVDSEAHLAIYVTDNEEYTTSTYYCNLYDFEIDSNGNFYLPYESDIVVFCDLVVTCCDDYTTAMYETEAFGYRLSLKYMGTRTGWHYEDNIYYEPVGTHIVYDRVTEEVTQEITNKPLIVCYNICDCINNAFNITSVSAFNDMYVWLTNNLLNATPISHAIFNLVVYELIVDLFVCIIAVVTYPFKLFRKD